MSKSKTIESHDTPQENARYRHKPTSASVEYLNRDEDTYYFNVTGSDSTLELRVEDWPMYRDQLVFEGWRQ